MTAILDSVVKEGFSEEVMSLLRPVKEGKDAGRRQEHCGCVQGIAGKANVAKMK